jgi:hypothetical protein
MRLQRDLHLKIEQLSFQGLGFGQGPGDLQAPALH